MRTTKRSALEASIVCNWRRSSDCFNVIVALNKAIDLSQILSEPFDKQSLPVLKSHLAYWEARKQLIDGETEQLTKKREALAAKRRTGSLLK